MMVFNRNLLFQGSIFRFHVCFGGVYVTFPVFFQLSCYPVFLGTVWGRGGSWRWVSPPFLSFLGFRIPNSTALGLHHLGAGWIIPSTCWLNLNFHGIIFFCLSWKWRVENIFPLHCYTPCITTCQELCANYRNRFSLPVFWTIELCKLLVIRILRPQKDCQWPSCASWWFSLATPYFQPAT